MSQDATATARGEQHGGAEGAGAREQLLNGLPVTERRLSLRGGTTAVLEGGAGAPLVLLHGPGSYGLIWLRVVPDLVTTHRVIAPDLPAHGASAALDGPADAERVIRWLDDLIERTCASPPVLVGQTLGGAIAARYAAARGAALSRLVLVDTLGLTAFQPAPEFGAALSAFMADPTEETHDGLWRRCVVDLAALRGRLGPQWTWIKAYGLDRARTPAAAAQHALMAELGLPAIPPATLARIAVPTALIWGRHDLAIPLDVARDASARYGWPLHVIEEAGADAPLEQPEAFVAALRAALAAR
jgi:pimeloyl-ACP methyl ester carboxylesterase